ncbi:hypothetical protein, partial [Crossiella equi]
MRAQLKRLAVVGAGLAVAAGTAVLSAPAASAVPDCVKALSQHETTTHLAVTVRNGCDTPQQVRIRFEGQQISFCREIPAG